jgi:uncharacterized protein (TIGR03000 family)
MDGFLLPKFMIVSFMALGQSESVADPEVNHRPSREQPVVQMPTKRRAMAFNIPGFQRGQPLGSYDPWWYGYNFGDQAAGFYGGGNYTRYYAYTRGFPSLGDFPGPVPGRVWTNDPKRTPYLHQSPQFTQPGFYPEGAVPRSTKPANKQVSGERSIEENETNLPVNPKLTARISIVVPEQATIKIEGIETRQTGVLREFISPQLVEDVDYVYHLRAEWLNENGQAIERDSRVVIKAGCHKKVLFSVKSENVLVESVK